MTLKRNYVKNLEEFLPKKQKSMLRQIFKSKQKIEDPDLIQNIINYINSRSWSSKSSFKLFYNSLKNCVEKDSILERCIKKKIQEMPDVCRLTFSIMPTDLKMIHDKCFEKGETKKKISFWLLVIISIRCYNRINELLKLTVDDVIDFGDDFMTFKIPQSKNSKNVLFFVLEKKEKTLFCPIFWMKKLCLLMSLSPQFDKTDRVFDLSYHEYNSMLKKYYVIKNLS